MSNQFTSVVLHNLFSLFDSKDLSVCSLVCRKWRYFSNRREDIWLPLITKKIKKELKFSCLKYVANLVDEKNQNSRFCCLKKLLEGSFVNKKNQFQSYCTLFKMIYSFIQESPIKEGKLKLEVTISCNFEVVFDLLPQVIDFGRVIHLKFSADLFEPQILAFFGLFKKLEKINMKRPYYGGNGPSFSDNIYLYVSKSFPNLKELSLENVRCSAKTLATVIERCKELRELSITFSGVSVLKCLASSNIPNLNHLRIQERETDVQCQNYQEKERLLCRFIRNSGENLLRLDLTGCYFVTDHTFETIAECCPNFEALFLSDECCEDESLPFSLSSLSKVGAKCRNFPKLLHLNYPRNNFEVEDAKLFMEQFYPRIQNISIQLFRGPLQQLIDVKHLNPSKLEKVMFGSRDLNPKSLLESLSSFKKLKVINFDKALQGNFPPNTEMRFDCLEKLYLQSEDFCNLNVIAPNLRVCDAPYIRVDTNQRVEELTISYGFQPEIPHLRQLLQSLRPNVFQCPDIITFEMIKL